MTRFAKEWEKFMQDRSSSHRVSMSELAKWQKQIEKDLKSLEKSANSWEKQFVKSVEGFAKQKK